MFLSPEMKVVLDVSPFWDDDLTGIKLAQELGMNYRSISTLRKGTDRGSWETLIKLSRFFSKRLGREVTIEDLLVIKEDD